VVTTITVKRVTCWTGCPAHACASAAVASPAALVARPGGSPSNVCISCWPAVVSVDGADADGTELPPPAVWPSTCCCGWFSWDVDGPPDRSLGFFFGFGLTRSDACRPVVLRYVCSSSLYAICNRQTAVHLHYCTTLVTYNNRSAVSGCLAVTGTRTTLGRRNFAVTGATIWNNLLANLRLHSQSLLSFGQNTEKLFVWAMSAPEEFCLSRAIQMFALLLLLLLLLYQSHIHVKCIFVMLKHEFFNIHYFVCSR